MDKSCARLKKLCTTKTARRQSKKLITRAPAQRALQDLHRMELIRTVRHRWQHAQSERPPLRASRRAGQGATQMAVVAIGPILAAPKSAEVLANSLAVVRVAERP
eukprot:CAMPEP_0177517640 /NCGR_PEP_ID=MMETSP0369-20130122/46086_1 /TAXON_ID=447022 ORGANISM="Scrippsiella hangoei-like, Strain SHHI-4" /NCGR_SAMPLE_ID=MMETSP0369 /ASSEMBLY_ACC=CAM_ASM_000364 /LENGTH=104 /DNA_ID=CAMNT_0018996667 /DNA_START=779 /DNA_END=1089 /DNA_ORIENTATION=+